MSDIAEPYAQAPDHTGRVVAGIKPGQWEAGRPCTGWAAKERFVAILGRRG
jgi:hypothetical protein